MLKSAKGRLTPAHATNLVPRSQRHAKQIIYDHNAACRGKVVKEYKCDEKGAASQIDADPRRLGADVGITAVNGTEGLGGAVGVWLEADLMGKLCVCSLAILVIVASLTIYLNMC